MFKSQNTQKVWINVVRASHYVIIRILHYWVDFYIAIFISGFILLFAALVNNVIHKGIKWNARIEWTIEMIEVNKTQLWKKKMKNYIFRDKNARVYLSRSRSVMICNATDLRPAYNV